MSPVPNLALEIPNFWRDRVPETRELTSFFQRAEELGFHSLWITDRLFHTINLPHCLTLLTYAAACTSRIELGTAVLLLSLRHPADVARQAATLDVLSGGRLTLGVALGGWGTEYDAMSMPQSQRVGRLEEGMTVLRKLWTETDVTFHGKYYHLEKANVAPKPVRPGGIPLPMGAATPLGQQRAGRIADGWITAAHGTPESFERSWNLVQEAARQAGRDPSTLTNRAALYTNLDPDKDRARRDMMAYLSAYYGEGRFATADEREVSLFQRLERDTVATTTQEVTQIVRAFGEVGCQTVALHFPWPDVAQLELIAAEVMPALR